MSLITALQWKDAALSAFTRTLGDLLDLKPRDLSITLHSHPHTAAVSWVLTRQDDLDDLSPVTGARVHLFLPAMRPGSKLTRRDADALAGYWVHEACHVLYTDRAAWDLACRRSTAFRNVVNGLEDVRIERLLIDAAKVPGAVRVLHEIVERAVWPAPVTPATVNAKSGLAGLLAYLGRARCNGFTLALADDMEAALTPANAALVRDVLAGTARARSTADVVEIVDRLFSGGFVIDGPATPMPQTPDMGDDDAEGDDLSDLANDATEGEAQRDDATAPRDDAEGDDADAGEGEGDDADAGEGDDAAKGEGAGAGQDDADAGDADAGDMGDGQASTTGEAHDGHGDGPTGDDEADTLASVTDRDDVASAEPQKAAQDVADAVNGDPLTPTERDLFEGHMGSRVLRDAEYTCNFNGPEIFDNLDGVGALRIAVRRLVVSPERFGWTRHLERGRIDPGSLHRSRLGHRDIFRRVDQAEGHRAAVSVLLDMSGSMGRNTVPQAVMAYHVAAAVEAAGAPVAVNAFTGTTNLAAVKRFKDRVRNIIPRFLAAGHAPGSCTPLGPSIMKAGSDLALVDATTRVLFVLTDGDDDHGATRVRAAIDAVRGLGVVVVGLVIGHGRANVAHYGFDAADAALSVEADALSGAVLGELVKLLDRARPTRGAAA